MRWQMGLMRHDSKPAPALSGLATCPTRAAACLALAAAVACATIMSAGCAQPQSIVGEVATAAGAMEAAVGITGASAGSALPQQASIPDGSYDLDASDLLGVPGSADVIAFNWGTGENASIPVAQLANVRSAAAAIESVTRPDYSGEIVYDEDEDDYVYVESEDSEGIGCSCGFVFLDVDLGQGVAYNADQTMYVASAVKAPFIYYLLVNGFDLDEDEREEVEYVLVDSDNDSFDDLSFSYLGDGYVDWLAAYGVNAGDIFSDFYPPMSARNLAGMWADMLLFLQGGSEDARWMAGLMASTEDSFIRDGLRDTGATVMNKAGWIGWVGYDSVSDAAIIRDGDRTFIMVITTDQPEGDITESNVSELARALFNLRYFL